MDTRPKRYLQEQSPFQQADLAKPELNFQANFIVHKIPPKWYLGMKATNSRHFVEHGVGESEIYVFLVCDKAR